MTGLKHVNAAGTRVYMGVLTGGVDIHETLAGLAARHHIQAATFDLLGGLHSVSLRGIDFATGQRGDALTIEGTLEVTAGHGTISLLDGQPYVHLHTVIAYRDSQHPGQVQVVAGHVSASAAFAIEVTITAYDGSPVERGLHPATGLMLWQTGG